QEGESGVVTLDVPKRLIASKLGSQPETFSRILHRLIDSGMIAVQRRRIEILDSKGLAAHQEEAATDCPRVLDCRQRRGEAREEILAGSNCQRRTPCPSQPLCHWCTPARAAPTSRNWPTPWPYAWIAPVWRKCPASPGLAGGSIRWSTR